MSAPLEKLAARALRIRRLAVRLGQARAGAQAQVQTHDATPPDHTSVRLSADVGLALGAADLLAVLFGDMLRLGPSYAAHAGCDHLLLPAGGRYTLAQQAALIDAGLLPDSVVAGAAWPADAPALSVGTGNSSDTDTDTASDIAINTAADLQAAVALATELQGQASTRRVVQLLHGKAGDDAASWAGAARAAAAQGLGRLLVIVDLNLPPTGTTPEGRPDARPAGSAAAASVAAADADTARQALHWQACGWRVLRVDGNRIGPVRSAIDTLRTQPGRLPCVLLASTRPGHGVPVLAGRLQAGCAPITGAEWTTALVEVDAAMAAAVT
ncbi:MAG: hypothetical protein RLZZ584_1549 [Pseudomonadota bacterium]